MQPASLVVVGLLVCVCRAGCSSIALARYSSHFRQLSDHNATDATVLFTNDADDLICRSIDLLLHPSQVINSGRWRRKRDLYIHNITSFTAAHELVTERASYSLGFTRPARDTLVQAAGSTEGLTNATSVPFVGASTDGITFAAFNHTGDTFTSVSLSNGTWIPTVHHTPVLQDVLYSPSAAFLRGSTKALLNRNHYDPTLYRVHGGNWTKVPTAPFYRAGGENIGSLFTKDGRTHAVMRFNVPYNPYSVNGHGYRSIGVYDVSYNGTNASAKVHSWLASDGCLKECYEQWHQAQCASAFLTLDGQKLVSCLEQEGPGYDYGSASIPVRSEERISKRCLLSALQNDTVVASSACLNAFASLADCAQECRMRNQIYQPAVSVHGEHMYGVFGRYMPLGNCHQNLCGERYHVCRLLDGFEWDEHCFDEDSIFLIDTEGESGHPVSSELVLEGDTYYLATASRESASFVYRWSRHNFSYITTKKNSSQGTVSIPMVLPQSQRIFLFCRSTRSTKQCDLQIKARALTGATEACRTETSEHRGLNHHTKIEIGVQCSPGTDHMLLTVSFMNWHRLYGLSTE